MKTDVGDGLAKSLKYRPVAKDDHGKRIRFHKGVIV